MFEYFDSVHDVYSVHSVYSNQRGIMLHGCIRVLVC